MPVSSGSETADIENVQQRPGEASVGQTVAGQAATSQTGGQIFFNQLEPDNFAFILDELQRQTASEHPERKADAATLQARRDYFETAIETNANLAVLSFKDIASWNTGRLVRETKQLHYTPLVEQLLAETAEQALEGPLARPVAEGRRAYFETLINRGADLTELPFKDIASWNAADLQERAKAIPDRAVFSEADRNDFALAGERRSPSMQWDNLFPEGQNEVILPFVGGAQSFDDKIKIFLDSHNAAAPRHFAAAQEKDAAELARNPRAKAKAGKNEIGLLNQRQIRMDPEKPYEVQSLNPNVEGGVWEKAGSLPKVLQSEMQWSLYTDFDEGPGAANRNKAASAEMLQEHPSTDLRSIANTGDVEADPLFDSDALSVVISRDPQKLGEMSTGQRWASCMRKGGVNFQFVPADIEKGSLVAYVVLKGDVEARYPLMRQLIKPFRQGEGPYTQDNTILVPAISVYGGGGRNNSRTQDGLKITVTQFVARQNGGLSGEFEMDPALYTDGQPTITRMSSDWSREGVQKALTTWQETSTLEWITELKLNSDALSSGYRNAQGHDPASQIPKLKKKLVNLYDAQSLEKGLPRMFFREMERTALGTKPEPRMIAEVAQTDTELNNRAKAFKALRDGKEDLWTTYTENTDPSMRRDMAFVAAITAQPGSDAEKFASRMWSRDVATLSSETEQLDVYKKTVAQAPAGSGFDRLVAEHFAERIEAKPLVADRITSYQVIAADAPKDSRLGRRAIQGITDNVPQLPEGSNQNEIYRQAVSMSASDTVGRLAAAQGALDTTEDLPLNKRAASYRFVSENVPRTTFLRGESLDRMYPTVAALDTLPERIAGYEHIARFADEGSPLYRAAGESVKNSIDALPNVSEQSAAYLRVAEHASYESQWAEDSSDLYMAHVDALPRRARIATYQEGLANNRNYVLKEKLVQKFIDNVDALPSIEERLRTYAAAAVKPPNMDERHALEWPATNGFLATAESLPTPEGRMAAYRDAAETARTINDRSEFLDVTVKKFFETGETLPAPERIELYRPLLRSATRGLRLTATEGILDNVENLPTREERALVYRDLYEATKATGGDFRQARRGLAMYADALPTPAERIAGFEPEAEASEQGSAERRRALEGILENAGSLAMPEERAAKFARAGYLSSGLRDVSHKASVGLSENVDALPRNEQLLAQRKIAHWSEPRSELAAEATASMLRLTAELPTVEERVASYREILSFAADDHFFAAEAAGKAILAEAPSLNEPMDRIAALGDVAQHAPRRSATFADALRDVAASIDALPSGAEKARAYMDIARRYRPDQFLKSFAADGILANAAEIEDLSIRREAYSKAAESIYRYGQKETNALADARRGLADAIEAMPTLAERLDAYAREVASPAVRDIAIAGVMKTADQVASPAERVEAYRSIVDYGGREPEASNAAIRRILMDAPLLPELRAQEAYDYIVRREPHDEALLKAASDGLNGEGLAYLADNVHSLPPALRAAAFEYIADKAPNGSALWLRNQNDAVLLFEGQGASDLQRHLSAITPGEVSATSQPLPDYVAHSPARGSLKTAKFQSGSGQLSAGEPSAVLPPEPSAAMRTLLASGAPALSRFSDDYPEAGRKLRKVLRQHHEDQVEYLKEPHARPAEAYAEAFGFDGISRKYQLPNGVTAADLESAMIKKGGLAALMDNLHRQDFGNAAMQQATGGIARRANSANQENFNSVLNQLVELNPELKALKFDRSNTVDVYHAVLGVTSGFNVDDINHFIAGGRADKLTVTQTQRLETIEGRTGAALNWVPSDETITRMHQQVLDPAFQSRAPNAVPHEPTTISAPSQESHQARNLAIGAFALPEGLQGVSHLTNAVHAANAPIGVAMGAAGLYDKLGHKDNDYHKDVAAGGTRATLAHIGLAADSANLGIGLIDSAHSVSRFTKSLSAVSEVAEISEGGLLGTATKVAGRAAIPLAVVAGAVETGAAIKAHDGHRAARAVGSTTGGIAGGIAAGMVAGAVVGSVIPVAGTAVGAVVGLAIGVGGALIGGWAGGKATDAVAGNWADRLLHRNEQHSVLEGLPQPDPNAQKSNLGQAPDLQAAKAQPVKTSLLASASVQQKELAPQARNPDRLSLRQFTATRSVLPSMPPSLLAPLPSDVTTPQADVHKAPSHKGSNRRPAVSHAVAPSA